MIQRLRSRLVRLERQSSRRPFAKSIPEMTNAPAETADLDQCRAILEASLMRADGRLAPDAYLDGMVDWQREFLDTYGEAFASLMHDERKGNVDPA
jgi:hypothetical protein